MIIIILLFLLFSDATSISFNFTSFDPNTTDIKLEGNASVNKFAIQLTSNIRYQTGHATYAHPMQLWDASSGSLADFTSNFSFSIDNQNNSDSDNGDGLAFFIASLHYRFPEKQEGAGLGLASGNLILNSKENPFVAVEFDTVYNSWDEMLHDHVGIDINSLQSVRSVAWNSDTANGRPLEVGVSYNSSSKNLCVSFPRVSENIILPQDLCYEADLRNYLSEWAILGFSAATGSESQLHTIRSWSFNSNLKTKILTSKTGRRVAGWIIGMLVCGCVLLLVSGSLCWIWRCRYKKKNRGQHEQDLSRIQDRKESETDSFTVEWQEINHFKRLLAGAKDISHDILASATNNFDEKEKLGEGGFGAVFKGFLKDLNIHVAVKRISSGSAQGMAEYAAEITIISQLRHRNLVQLIGWCHEKKDLLIVYEYLPNRSLDFHLFSGESLLNWEQRYKIAQGLASALDYLHEGWRNCVLHRDIKSSNVMLDSEFNPMLGDFGLARIVDHDHARSQTLLGGSYGYMAPECLETGKSSKESDVFSFGVVALEIACRKKAFVPREDGSQVHIAKWVWELYENGELVKAVDEKLQGNFLEKQMERLMIVGLWCAHPDYSIRPSVREAINVLSFVAPMPELTSKFPRITPSPPLQTSPPLSSINSTFRNVVTQNAIDVATTDPPK